MTSFFELYLVKGDPQELLLRILWLAIPFLFWFPLVVLTGLLICSRSQRVMQFCVPAYYVSLSTVLFCSAILLAPLTGGAGLFRLFGWSRGYILGAAFGFVTGAWFGWNVAKQVNRASAGLRKPFGVVLRMIAAVLMLFASYLPLALFEDSLGGGSGYGDGLPRVASKFFEHQIEPWFYYVLRWVFRGGIMLHWGYQILSGIFWLLVICSLFSVSRRFLKAIRLGDGRTLIRLTAGGVVLVTATLILFFSVNEGEARPHIETICASLMTVSEIELSTAKASVNETYPTTILERERKTMSKYFEQWSPTPIQDDPSFRVTSIAPDGTTEIELIKSGTKLRSKPGRPLVCREYGTEGLWLTGASFEKQTARFTRYISNDEEARSATGSTR